MSFGNEIKQTEFVLKNEITFINHGSYGTAPKEVLQTRLQLIKEQEEDPNEWFRVYSLDYHKASISSVAEFVGANEENLVFVDNATTGINHVVKSLRWSAEDVILMNSFTYNAIQYTCKAAVEKTEAKVAYLDITEPFQSTSTFINQLTQHLQNNPHIKLAVLDYISSPTATHYPVVELIKVCKKYNVMVAIDGAHAPGQVPLNLEELGQLGMDFFTGNMHKWAYCCRGCAILWVNPKHHDIIRPLVTSFQYLYHSNDFRSRFVRNGTNDRSNFYSAKAGVEFIKRHGGVENIVKYTSSLLDEAVDYLVKLWGTKKYPLPKDMEAPNMRIVRLPDLKKFPLPPRDAQPAFLDYTDLAVVLRKRFNIAAYVAIIGNQPWTRLSANVYNTIEDYHRLGEAICQLVKEENEN